jgi:hypothetical protein
VSTSVRRTWFGWVREIARETGPYLTRWSLRKQYGEGESEKNGGARVYLHRFFSPDSELHNHPWHWSFSIVLWGSYTEYYFDEKPEASTLEGMPAERYSVRRVRWFNWIGRDRFHQIVELHPTCGRVYTLFVCGPAHGRNWGFWVPGRGLVQHGKRKAERGLPS